MSAVQPRCAHEAELGRLDEAIIEIKDTLRDVKELLKSNATLSERMTAAQTAISNIDTRLRKLELAVARHQGSGKWIERVVWCLVSAALGFYAKSFIL